MVWPLLIIRASLLTQRTIGDVFSLRVFGQVIVILNTTKATKDLLEKRGEIYSDRPIIPIFEMCVHSDLTRPI